MSPRIPPTNDTDPFNLRRFVQAQEPIYANVLAELRNGRKRTHWMWFIFPQLTGLGHSPTAKHYAILGREEAQHYLTHPILGQRLIECSSVVLQSTEPSAWEIFGSPDDVKLRSSMTLFTVLPAADAVFAAVLDKYFEGKPDSRTLALLSQADEPTMR
jgi:uncharacterized protein (DUF1810 family)